MIADGYRLSFGSDEKHVELYSGDVATQLRNIQIPTNCTFKWVNF